MRRAIWGVLIISVVSAFGGVASAQVSDEVVRLGVIRPAILGLTQI